MYNSSNLRFILNSQRFLNERSHLLISFMALWPVSLIQKRLNTNDMKFGFLGDIMMAWDIKVKAPYNSIRFVHVNPTSLFSSSSITLIESEWERKRVFPIHSLCVCNVQHMRLTLIELIFSHTCQRVGRKRWRRSTFFCLVIRLSLKEKKLILSAHTLIIEREKVLIS